MAKRKQRTVRVRSETGGRPREAPAAAAPRRRASVAPIILWAAGAVLAIGLAVALVAAVGTAGLAGNSRWGYIACLFILGVAALLLGAKAAEAYLNWKEPGWQPRNQNRD